MCTATELDENSVVAFFATTDADGKVYEVEYFNMDVILAVGYRVNSKRGVQFRKWASSVLKDYLVKGYSLNRDKLVQSKIHEVQSAIDLIGRTLVNNYLVTDVGSNILDIIKKYAKTWDLLIKYDSDNLIIPMSLHSSSEEIISYNYAIQAISSFKSEIEGEALFGIERGEIFNGILGNVMQSFGGTDLYPSIEEKAAHLLYFIIKDHPFSDGNKRIGSFLFLLYLKMLGFNIEQINDNLVTALALLVAESDPKQKELMINLVLHILV